MTKIKRTAVPAKLILANQTSSPATDKLRGQLMLRLKQIQQEIAMLQQDEKRLKELINSL